MLQIPRVQRDATKPGRCCRIGLALDQVLQEVLAQQRPQLKFRSGAVFAQRSLLRQVGICWKTPIYFPSSIYKTDKEAILWRQFWFDQGLKLEVAHGLGEAGTLSKVEEVLSHPKVRAVGLVVDEVDDYDMELGTAGMHNQVRQWAS